MSNTNISFRRTSVCKGLIDAVPTLIHSVLFLATVHSRDDISTITVRKDMSVVAICVRNRLIGHLVVYAHTNFIHRDAFSMYPAYVN
jgi:hypothetical protein